MMLPNYSVQNLLCWMLQVGVIVCVGMWCPKILRIRHPRSQLLYCYGLLALFIALPFIHPFAGSSMSARIAVGLRSWPLSEIKIQSMEAWGPAIVAIIGAGITAKLCLLAVGFFRIRHYKETAIPFEFPKDTVLAASRVTHENLAIGISAHEVGPVTMGWIRPTILLPASFLALDEDAQHAILSHELMHVTRNDWAMTLFEELIGACLWFHPAIWWLLARIRITREQVVDAEIVRRPSNREPYIEALLAMAAVEPERTAHPAAMFVRSRQLSERLRLLLDDHRISRKRLLISYASLGALLIATSLLALNSFPIAAAVHKQETVHLAPQPTMHVFEGKDDTAPRLIEQVIPEYSDAARLAGIHGTVMLEGIVGADGRMAVKKIVRHLDPELDRNAAAAVNQWRFEPAVRDGTRAPVPLLVEVAFNLK